MLEALLVSLLPPLLSQQPPDPDAGWIQELFVVDERFADGRRGWGGGTGPQAFGYSLASVGDVDGDGVADLAIGTPAARGREIAHPWRGFVSIVCGRTGEELCRVEGANEDDQLGKSLAAAGDLNGDEADDLVAGTVGGYGPVVLSGSDGSLLGEIGIELPGETVCAAAGDMDGDGVPDVLLAYPEFDLRGTDRGLVSVHFSANFLAGDYRDGSRDLLGESAGDGLGWALAGNARLDEDEVPDLLASAHRGNIPRQSCSDRPGVVRAFSGASGRKLFQVEGRSPGECFGKSLALLGDLDGDGFDDFVVGAPGHDEEWFLDQRAGVVRGFSGRDGSELFEVRRGPSFGYSLATLGDVDGDGSPDFAAGAYRRDGEVVVFSGATRELIARVAASQGAAIQTLGGAVAAVADRDGDGAIDIACSTAWRNFVSQSWGRVLIVSSASGEVLDTVRSPLWR